MFSDSGCILAGFDLQKYKELSVLPNAICYWVITSTMDKNWEKKVMPVRSFRQQKRQPRLPRVICNRFELLTSCLSSKRSKPTELTDHCLSVFERLFKKKNPTHLTDYLSFPRSVISQKTLQRYKLFLKWQKIIVQTVFICYLCISLEEKYFFSNDIIVNIKHIPEAV